MPQIGLGVTIGSHSLRGVLLKRKGEGFVVQRVFADRISDETTPLAGRALAGRGLKGVPVTLGLTGRDVIIRYTQIPPVPEWRLKTLMKYEVEEVSSQSGGDVSADYHKLTLPDPDGSRDDDTVLVALARNRHLDRLSAALGSGGLKLGEATPNSVALFNAFAVNATYREDETALLVNLGAENVDIALQRGGELLFARNATPGGKAFTEAIEQAFATTFGKAEKMKTSKGDVTPKGQARYADPTAEKVANSIIGVAGQLSSMIQSTMMIARAQTRLPDLKVDRVVLAGGGASLTGLDLYLKQAMGVPVERFDPFVLSDLTGLSDEERELVTSAPHEFAVAVGLAQSTLSPAAFRLAVLPEKVKRARDFAQKGVWAVAAGAVALGALFFLYKGRSDAAAAYDKERSAVQRTQKEVRAEDERLRQALGKFQQVQVKHRLLADMALPGAFYAEALDLLENSATEHIYLNEVRLQVDKKVNTFSYLVGKGGSAKGYEESSRTAGEVREPWVQIDGRVSGGENPSRIWQEFVEALNRNKSGIVVETEQAFKSGPSGQPGTFKMRLRPGVKLEPATEGDEGIRQVLRYVDVDNAEEPTAFVGRRANGEQVTVPLDSVKKDQREELLNQIKNRR
ncbi:MAG: pilus assembly protein PilM [Planctomycetota bacterium]